jgi:hypothetical protein
MVRTSDVISIKNNKSFSNKKATGIETNNFGSIGEATCFRCSLPNIVNETKSLIELDPKKNK